MPTEWSINHQFARLVEKKKKRDSNQWPAHHSTFHCTIKPRSDLISLILTHFCWAEHTPACDEERRSSVRAKRITNETVSLVSLALTGARISSPQLLHVVPIRNVWVSIPVKSSCHLNSSENLRWLAWFAFFYDIEGQTHTHTLTRYRFFRDGVPDQLIEYCSVDVLVRSSRAVVTILSINTVVIYVHLYSPTIFNCFIIVKNIVLIVLNYYTTLFVNCLLILHIFESESA